jgi:hypothetical protein
MRAVSRVAARLVLVTIYRNYLVAFPVDEKLSCRRRNDLNNKLALLQASL